MGIQIRVSDRVISLLAEHRADDEKPGQTLERLLFENMVLSPMQQSIADVVEYLRQREGSAKSADVKRDVFAGDAKRFRRFCCDGRVRLQKLGLMLPSVGYGAWALSKAGMKEE